MAGLLLWKGPGDQVVMKNRSRQSRRNEEGAIVVVAAVGMMTLILFAALAVDISHLYLVKAEVQNGVDAAALAAASGLNATAGGITEAVDRALELNNKYEFNQKKIPLTRANVEFSKNYGGPYISESSAKAAPKNIRFVKVTASEVPVKVFFGLDKIANPQKMNVPAIAGQSVPTNVYCDWIPLSVIDDNVNQIIPGNLYTIRSEPGKHVSPGNYQILAVAGRGGKDVRIGLASGVDECLGPGDEVDTKPGITAGPVRAGINTRFDEYSSILNPTDHPPDTNIKENITYEQYANGSSTQSPGNTGVPGRRIVLIPIIKIGEFGNGRDTVKIDRFGAFFLRSKVAGGNGGDIQAEYIGERISVGRSGYNPNGGPTNALITTIVLYD
jgi:hypothetical protein